MSLLERDAAELSLLKKQSLDLEHIVADLRRVLKGLITKGLRKENLFHFIDHVRAII
nr:hypothetical protein [uncultured Desulfuromonas sp.]